MRRYDAAKASGNAPQVPEFGVADGTRTHDNRNHNPGLYQLSYSHHGYRRLPRRVDVWRARQDSNLLPPA